MAEKHDVEKNNEQTLLTLDQLSQTLDAMSIVVERLRKHVARQASLNAELAMDDGEEAKAAHAQHGKTAGESDDAGFVVEISARDMEDLIDPIVH